MIERRNARDLGADELSFAADLATVDGSFISVAKVLAPVARCVREDGELLVLVKPQFELGREGVGKGGVVRDPAARRDALRGAAAVAADAGLMVRGFASSGLPARRATSGRSSTSGAPGPAPHQPDSGRGGRRGGDREVEP